jgi:hypothetical protein
MPADAFSMFWLTVLFFIVVPGILYWICCDPNRESRESEGAHHSKPN